MSALDWPAFVLLLLVAVPLAIYGFCFISRSSLEKAISRLISGQQLSPDDPLLRAIEFQARRNELRAATELAELQDQMSRREQELTDYHSELRDEALRLETLQAQLEDESRYQSVLRICTQSLARDYVAAVNEGKHDEATQFATHLTALLRAPYSVSEIGSFALLELIDEVLIRLAPIARHQHCEFLVVPLDAGLSNVEINAPRFQDILFHLLVHHLANPLPGKVGLEFSISENHVDLSFVIDSDSDVSFDPVISIELDEALTDNDAWYRNNCLQFPVRPHPGAFASDSGLRALVVADSELERRSITGRLSQLGLEATTDFNSGIVDVCVVADETSESFRALNPYLSESTYVLLLGNRTIHHDPLWIQVGDPVTQDALKVLIQDISNVRDETAHKQILAVDDSQANIQLLEMQLTELGHSVTVARSGTEALAQVEKNNFDLVFMDIQMPDMNGADATRQIRIFNQKLPIIGLTAHATALERDEYNAAGIDDVLIKPVRMENLKSIIHRTEKASARPPLPAAANNRLPIFDLDLSLANANQRIELAAELLDLLIAGLPEDQKGVNDVAGDYTALRKNVHKLHGAVRYCGVPRLNRAIEKLETALKQDDAHQVPLLLNLLNGEIAALIAWRRKNPDVLQSP
ncbi:MAG: response regulator [Pseudomonadales bacterium]|nr:response regulator [Pseudomonadales bacterium]MBO6596298.1 response regulator [Pseudomonadales bacterium]MBO6822778.1 response regulator [Pseudomonadales bacterium]